MLRWPNASLVQVIVILAPNLEAVINAKMDILEHLWIQLARIPVLMAFTEIKTRELVKYVTLVVKLVIMVYDQDVNNV